MSEPHTPLELIADLCAEQRRRWRQGDRVPATAYLERHPGLARADDYAVELVYNEVLLREEHGETPALDEYLRQFPQWAPQLRRLFEVHAAMAASSVIAAHETGPAPRAAPAVGPAAWPDVPGYEILGELGRGGMGVVYRARHVGLQRLVALKMIRAGGQAEPEDLLRFRREAEAVARLQHPNVVQIYDVGEHGGLPYFSLEYVAGGSLAGRLDGTPVPAGRAAELVRTLAQAMQAAHDRGIVHRDLKPGNVLLTADGTPKVADFGLAKQLDGGHSQTQSGSLLGTPGYMAPEQAAGRRRAVGPASDVHALGAILYELLTGRPPFQGESLLETLQQVQYQEPVPPRRLQPAVPRDLEAISLKCLEKVPEARYASAAALAADLQRFLDGKPVHARPTGSLKHAWLWCRRPERVRDAGVFAVLVGLVFGLWLGLGLLTLAVKGVAELERPSGAYLTVATDLGCCVAFIVFGRGTIRGRRRSLWGGLVAGLLLLALSATVLFGWEFDAGGWLKDPDVRRGVFSLLATLGGLLALAYSLALGASHANPEYFTTKTQRAQRIHGE
jgi:hypothetical protein